MGAEGARQSTGTEGAHFAFSDTLAYLKVNGLARVVR